MKEDSLIIAFGRRLKGLRNELGLTQLQVADRARLDVRYFSRIENGKINVTLMTLFRLARAMKCPRLLSLPTSPLEDMEAGLCSSICQMARRGESKQLQQVDKFVHHVLGVRPDSDSKGCLASAMAQGRHGKLLLPAPSPSKSRKRTKA